MLDAGRMRCAHTSPPPKTHTPILPVQYLLPVSKPHPRHLAQAVCLYLDIDRERVFEPCRRATGSITEACVLLLRNLEPADGADTSRADTSRADTLVRPFNIPPRVAEVLAMLREGWRPVLGQTSGRAAHADGRTHVSARVEPGGHVSQVGGHVGPPLHARLILLYISPPSYTLGIRAADGAYIPIGKVDRLSDLHPDERAKLRKRAKSLVIESFGPTSLLKPEIVVEATYSHIEINTRTKAGKVLRNVAITRICWDESIESIAALESL